jgi:hypothetical protein
MKTLSEMQQATPADLRTEALATTNRQYAIACEQMAHAMTAHAAGDFDARKAHVERCKVAHKRAHEDELGQLIRVRATAAAIAAENGKVRR